MIVPFPWRWHSFQTTPFTFLLMGFLVCTHLILWSIQGDSLHKSYQLFRKESTVVTSGHLYSQYLHQKGKNPKFEYLVPQQPSYYEQMGYLSRKDLQFVEDSLDFQFFGDPLLIQQWRQDMSTWKSEYYQSHYMTYGLVFGVPRFDSTIRYFTYQFVHSNFVHLLGNILFLYFFGMMVELFMGGFVMLIVFLGGGVFAGWFYKMSLLWVFGDLTSAPLVGASGSITALMAFYFVIEYNHRVKFFYFFAPIENYFGSFFASKWLMLPVLFVPDLVDFMSIVPELGQQIGFAAHLGGMTYGWMMGLLLRLIWPYFGSHSESNSTKQFF